MIVRLEGRRRLPHPSALNSARGRRRPGGFEARADLRTWVTRGSPNGQVDVKFSAFPASTHAAKFGCTNSRARVVGALRESGLLRALQSCIFGLGTKKVHGFQNTIINDVTCHSGDPTCDAAHAAMLGMLNQLGTVFLKPLTTLSNSQKGNLGEFISYQIARAHYPSPNHVRFSGNALNPLSRISGAGVDLVYVYFDSSDPTKDLIYIQEVKTTGAADLDYFDALKSDYNKLFDRDPHLSLLSRIQHIQNILEFDRDDFAASRRVAALASTAPAACSQVRLMPTGISTLGVGAPATKLAAIRSSIAAFGWPQANIEPWSIVMSDLENRLIRLARGLP